MSEGKPLALVVEDDEGVRGVVVGLLEELGYGVVQAWDAQGALAAWRDHCDGGSIHLVVLDNYFPAHRGAFARPNALPLARLMRPRCPVVVFSGDVDPDDATQLAELGIEWVEKPLVTRLGRAVKRAMSQEAET